VQTPFNRALRKVLAPALCLLEAAVLLQLLLGEYAWRSRDPQPLA
jgi:hypothetical protein